MSIEKMRNALCGQLNGRLHHHGLGWLVPCPKDFYLDILLLQLSKWVHVYST